MRVNKEERNNEEESVVVLEMSSLAVAVFGASFCWFLIVQRTSSFANLGCSKRSGSIRTPRAPIIMLHESNVEQATKAVAMAMAEAPTLDLPNPIRSEEEGTWAFDTMSRRVDAEILERTYQDNKEKFEQWDPQILANFDELRRELRNAANVKLTYPKEPSKGASSPQRLLEYEQWKAILKPHVDALESWLSSPWMVAEFYVYRRLMDCLGYWDAESPGYLYDPFEKQKQAGLGSSTASAESVLAKISQLPPTDDGLQVALSMALWGNKMDLSLWPADVSQNSDIFSSILAKAHENLLHDDSLAVAQYCSKLRDRGGGMVDIIVDNAGFELVTDLAAAQHLIESGIAHTVTFQLKSHPTFVSDALEKDLRETVDYYYNLDPIQNPAAQAAALKWRNYLNNNQWKCVEDPFWVQGLPMWKMHTPLYQDLKTRCDLAIVKGDANYRRLLGDLQWDFSAPFEEVVGAYFPCPVCALRTLKAEIGCGMAVPQTQRAAQADDKWMVNGRFGVVQFSDKNNKHQCN